LNHFFIGNDRSGQIAFNQPASRLLQKGAIDRVLLLWDALESKLALKTSGNKNDVRAYKIRFNERGNGASFSAKTFLDFAGIDYTVRKPIQILIDTNQDLFMEVKIPDNLIKVKGGSKGEE
jgi:hypothetical protein